MTLTLFTRGHKHATQTSSPLPPSGAPPNLLRAPHHMSVGGVGLVGGGYYGEGRWRGGWVLQSGTKEPLCVPPIAAARGLRAHPGQHVADPSKVRRGPLAYRGQGSRHPVTNEACLLKGVSRCKECLETSCLFLACCVCELTESDRAMFWQAANLDLPAQLRYMSGELPTTI